MTRGRARLNAGLAAGDPSDEVFYAQALRAVYAAGDEAAARDALAEFDQVATAADSPECRRLAKTIPR